MATKSAIRVMVLGEPGQGKTTLLNALSKVSNSLYGTRVFTYEDIPTRRERVNDSDIRYEWKEMEAQSSTRTLYLAETSDTNALTTWIFAQPNRLSGTGALWVCSALEYPGETARKQLELLRVAAIRDIVVFLGKAETASERQLVNVEAAIRSMLQELGFAADSTPVIRGSAQDALNDIEPALGAEAVAACMDAFDVAVTLEANKPLIMELKDVSTDGSSFWGLVRRGTLRTGQAVDLVGPRARQTANVTRIIRYGEEVTEASPGDVTCSLSIPVDQPLAVMNRSGPVVVGAQSMDAHTSVEIHAYVVKAENTGGYGLPLISDTRAISARLRVWHFDVSCTVQMLTGELATPGSRVVLSCVVHDAVALEAGTAVTVFVDKSTGPIVVNGFVSVLKE
ncbi:hypothetical protein [Luteibacter sp. 3190]|uniref:hypothetical protein n=1 Tax=Luteibacter sp. 3190 TaxID=2817736 RepID=UPI002863DCE7|nr:hypothetical protein [Luteibacter sp. 3190]MDR6936547.1 translation elongation factor EF-Tu-like GTPase [Luteibacter sp. 3190]